METEITGRRTGVGTASIVRFVRPVCYQDASEAALPAALGALGA